MSIIGQLQSVIEKLKAQVIDLKADNATAREVIESLCGQFAMPLDNPPRITTAGYSDLKAAFMFLGWSDPHPIPERGCQWKGCKKTATCGTPYKKGYLRVCGDHFSRINKKRK
jgi:hypothetical protein